MSYLLRLASLHWQADDGSFQCNCPLSRVDLKCMQILWARERQAVTPRIHMTESDFMSLTHNEGKIVSWISLLQRLRMRSTQRHTGFADFQQ